MCAEIWRLGGGTSESALESDGSARFGTTFCGFGVKLGLGGLKDSRIGFPKIVSYMGGCQNYGPFLGPYYNTAPII